MNISILLLFVGLLGSFSPREIAFEEHGIASYYHYSLKGNRMANGERYNPAEYTCAHPSLPFGTLLSVTRKDDPTKVVMVTVTDRGPFVEGRIIDLSRKAAEEIGLLHDGIAEVVITIVSDDAVTP